MSRQWESGVRGEAAQLRQAQTLSAASHGLPAQRQRADVRPMPLPIWIQGTWAGEAMRKSLDVDSWARAEELKRQIEDGNTPEEQPQGITIEDALKAFIADCETRNLNPATLRKYKLVRNRLTEFCHANGKHLLIQLEADSVRQEWRLHH